MVKKFLFSLIIMLGVTPAFGMWNDVRHSWIKNTLNSFPEDKQAFSPVVGVSLLEGTLGKKIYDEDSSRGQFAKNVLHYLDGRLRQPAVPSNPFCSIDALTIGKLIRAVTENKIEEFIESDVVVAWHQKHVTQTGRIAKENKFKRELKNKLKPIATMASQDVAYVFSMLAVVQSQNPDDFKTYSAQLGIDIEPEQFDLSQSQNDVNLDVEPMIFTISNYNRNAYDKLVPSAQLYADYKAEMNVPICGEQSLWGFVNLVLYNKEKNCLDFSQLPANIKLLPAFQAFIEKHKHIEDGDYYSKAANEWMALVSDISDVEYNRQRCEIKGRVENTVKILNHFFGCDVKDINKYGELFSTSERKISIVADNNAVSRDYPMVSVEVKDAKQAYYVKGTWCFRSGHISFSLAQAGSDGVYKFLKQLVEYELAQPWLPLAQSVLKYLGNVFFASEEELSTVIGVSQDEKYIFFEKIFKLPSFDIHKIYVQGLSLLEKAAKENDLKMVKLLVTYGAGTTPGLRRAVENDNFEMVKYLVEHGADATRELSDVKNNNFKMIKYLVEHGADASKGLFHALNGDRRDIVEYLVEHGADATKGIDTAVKQRNYKMVKYLVEHGADPSEGLGSAAETTKKYLVKERAVEEVERTRKYIIKYLIEQGADATKGIGGAADKGDFDMVKYFVTHGADVNSGFFHAIQRRNGFKIVKYLFEHGATVNNVYLQHAYKHVRDKNTVRFLMQQGADARSTMEDELRGQTLDGDFMIKHMLDPRKGLDGKFFRNKADLYRYKCDLGMDPVKELSYVLACMEVSPDVVKVLVERIENLSELFKGDAFDIGKKNFNIIKCLVDAEIDPNLVLDAYLTYLSTEECSVSKNEEIIYTLVQGGADVNRVLGKIIELYDNHHTDRNFWFWYYNNIKCCVEHGANPTPALAWAARTQSFSSFMGLMGAASKAALKNPVMAL